MMMLLNKLFKPYKRLVFIFFILFIPLVLYFLTDLFENTTNGKIADNVLGHLALLTTLYIISGLFPAVVIHDWLFHSVSVYVDKFLSLSLLTVNVLVYAIIINKLMTRNKTLGLAMIVFLLMLPFIVFLVLLASGPSG